ncbi:hypothetical protein [Pseudomonas frederiksbergensis]|uniref:Uncharacterized protein n=1 Tax=Pseudomonas frederiksbergensis TaxID=104087 RepID=A0A423HJ44_9PSED|nr:hypothetical protein [Pseudomonas frederiksbergensis]RON13137.1 hypothetical protein BK662_18350 [Pseudomonas frederiksbergensis]RON14247.1 hypothetical protein BK662_24345 [Pseudomonas frederiksbergensis]
MRRNLRFIWDDARVDADFHADSTAVLDAAEDISIRARMALAIGLYEWVVWRFDGLHNHTEPEQVLQASWCSTVDPRYLKYFEFERRQWTGPIDGPLWCAMTHLSFGLNNGYAYEGDLYSALGFLYRLAAHVLPERSVLDRWMQPILIRLGQHYPVQTIDPFADLFDYRIGEQLGPLIGRDVLDPALPPNMARDRQFLSETLANAVATKNPFLATPEDLKDLDFEGEPYLLPHF